MSKVSALSLLAATALGGAFGSKAGQAAVTVCTGNNCVATDENVLVNAATNVSTVTVRRKPAISTLSSRARPIRSSMAAPTVTPTFLPPTAC